MHFLPSFFSAVQRLFARRFFSELATTTTTTTTLAVPHLRVSGGRQYCDYRSYHKGSHFDGLRAHILSYSGWCAPKFFIGTRKVITELHTALFVSLS
jgi:hypothetical protein